MKMDKKTKKWLAILIVAWIVSTALVIVFFEDERPPVPPRPPPPNIYGVVILDNEDYITRGYDYEVDYLLEIDYKDRKIRNDLTNEEIYAIIIWFKVSDTQMPYGYGSPVGQTFSIRGEVSPEVFSDEYGNLYNISTNLWIVDNNTYTQNVYYDSFDSGNKTYAVQVDLNEAAFLNVEHEPSLIGHIRAVFFTTAGLPVYINLIITSIVK